MRRVPHLSLALVAFPCPPLHIPLAPRGTFFLSVAVLFLPPPTPVRLFVEIITAFVSSIVVVE